MDAVKAAAIETAKEVRHQQAHHRALDAGAGWPRPKAKCEPRAAAVSVEIERDLFIKFLDQDPGRLGNYP